MHLAVSVYQHFRTASHQHVSHADDPRVTTMFVQPADPRLRASVMTVNPPLQPESNRPISGESRRLPVIVFVFNRFVQQSTRYHSTTRCSQTRSIWPKVQLSCPSQPCLLLKKIGLICNPLSRTTSGNHNAFNASALTFLQSSTLRNASHKKGRVHAESRVLQIRSQVQQFLSSRAHRVVLRHSAGRRHTTLSSRK